MRKITDCAVLKQTDRFETITAMDFRKSPGEVFESVRLGKTFLVTKSGKPIAVVSKPPGETLAIIVKQDGSIEYGP